MPVCQDRPGSLSSVMTIYFVAGEVSADNHGAALMRCLRELDSELQFGGRGGPQMREVAGEQFKNWIADAAVLGLWEVLRKYGYFREQFHETLREIRESKPDAVVLIDIQVSICVSPAHCEGKRRDKR